LKKIRLLSIFCLLLLAAGCARQGNTPVVQQNPSPSVVAEPQVEETDLECSYFYFLWGRYAELTNRFDEALEAYEKALICDPSADYIARKLPVLLLRLDRDQEAGDQLRKYLQVHPDETGARMLLAKILIRQQAYDGAVEQYKTIHRQHPDETRSLLLLAELYLARGQYDSARKVLLQVLVLADDTYPAHVLLARIYAREKEVGDAVRHYKEALAINWSSELELEAGELYLQNKEYAEAETLFKKVLAREANNEEAGLALVQVYLLQKKEAAALSELRRLKRQSDNPGRIELAIARVYAQNKQYAKAADILQDLVKREDRPQTRYLLSIIYFQLKKYEKALEQLRQISRDAEVYEDSVFLQIRLLRLLKRPEDAVRVLEEALANRDVGNLDLYILLATLYQVQGNDALGEEVYDRALALHPDNAELLYEYGLFLEQAGKQDQAIAMMQKVLALEPDNAAALNYIGYTWADQGENLDQALEYIKRAVELKPENGYIRDSLGWVYFQLGHLDKAQQELEKAVALSSDDPAIQEHLGDVYLEAGRPRKALQVYRRALDNYTEEQEKTGIREKIQAVEKQLSR